MPAIAVNRTCFREAGPNSRTAGIDDRVAAFGSVRIHSVGIRVAHAGTHGTHRTLDLERLAPEHSPAGREASPADARGRGRPTRSRWARGRKRCMEGRGHRFGRKSRCGRRALGRGAAAPAAARLAARVLPGAARTPVPGGTKARHLAHRQGGSPRPIGQYTRTPALRSGRAGSDRRFRPDEVHPRARHGGRPAGASGHGGDVAGGWKRPAFAVGRPWARRLRDLAPGPARHSVRLQNVASRLNSPEKPTW